MEAYPSIFSLAGGRTIITFFKDGAGQCYQVLSADGYTMFTVPPLIATTAAGPYSYSTKMLPTPDGGVYVVWQNIYGSPFPGTYAQRLDSLGNRLWGDAGVLIHPAHWNDFDICPDGQGGFFAAVNTLPLTPTMDLAGQHVSLAGELLWGAAGLPLITYLEAQQFPAVAPDEQGGLYVIWEDRRPPNPGFGRIFSQRFDGQAQPLWAPATGREIWPGSGSFRQIFPDGQHGFIVYHGGGTNWNHLARYSPEGRLRWRNDEAGAGDPAKMVAGEPGYFYFAWVEHFHWKTIYGQRVDLQGRFHWSGPSGGAQVISPLEGAWQIIYPELDCFYRDSSFWVAEAYKVSHSPSLRFPFRIYVQALDAQANPRFGSQGLYICSQALSSHTVANLSAATDGSDGIVTVWADRLIGSVSEEDVFASHTNADGSFGIPPAMTVGAYSVQIKRSDSASIVYQINAPGIVSVTLFDLLGRKINSLQDGLQAPGNHSLSLSHLSLPSGVYIVTIRVDNQIIAGKVALIK